jgi:hypothetical protein
MTLLSWPNTKMKTRLTQDEMIDVFQLITDLTTSASIQSGLIESELSQFLETAKQYNPVFSLREDEFREIQELCFSNEKCRDFLMRLQFNFFLIFGAEKDCVRLLEQNIFDALLVGGRVLDYSALPDSIEESTAISVFLQREEGWLSGIKNLFAPTPARKLRRFIENNRWFVMFLLINANDLEEDETSSN